MIACNGVLEGIGILRPLRGTPKAQVHFADMSDYAFTFHGLQVPVAANPLACREVVTGQIFDPVLDQVFWNTCVGDQLLTHCSSIFPFAGADRSPGTNPLLLEGETSSVGHGL